jgi:N-acetylmuramoyl-L-alanine amidase
MLLALLAPAFVVVHSARGDVRLPVRNDPVAGPLVAATPLIRALNGTLTRGGGWIEAAIAGRIFRFYPGAPVFALDGSLETMVGSPVLRRDNLELPFQFVAEILPRTLGDPFRYDRRQARLVTSASPETVVTRPASAEPGRLPNGLRRGHVVTIDPGHGGVDPGNPGVHFPKGIREKDVNLQLGLLLRDELRRRGVSVVMTRQSDTLINLYQRAGFCNRECDLFVSLHVNSLESRPGNSLVRGFETFVLAETRTEDAARVARMENEAIRFEAPGAGSGLSGLDFILKDLQINEHLRESVRAAELMQSYLEEAHSGPNRGVKQAGLAVLNTARRPAILVETGFSTNPQDGRLLSTRTSQRNLAASMADAIIAYLLEYERKVGDNVSSGPAGRTGR